MKEKLITTDKAAVLVVELLKDGKFSDEKLFEAFIDSQKFMAEYMAEYVSYKLINAYPSITEEQASKIVDETDNPFWYGQGFKYIDYGKDDNCFKTALESLESLMQANGVCFENTLGEKPDKKDFYQGHVYMIGDHAVASNRWQESQSKVWDKVRTYLFIKT